MRTPEQKAATKARQKAERAAHIAKVMKKHPPAVRYAKAAFKKGSKRQKKSTKKLQLGVQ
jgi:hypothetical protein